jgi:D-lactate dehydrogenase
MSGGSLSAERQEQLGKMRILDLMEFAHGELLPKLAVEKLNRQVVLHPTCAARKMGIEGAMKAIAEKCATEVVIPLDLSCCATAGDRGMLYPELTQAALSKERREVLSRSAEGHYSNNLTCEIGLSQAMGVTYSSLIYLLEEAAEQGAYGKK